jgi:hypothetical protein
MLQSTIANAQRTRKTQAYKAEQFLPKWGRAKASGPMSGEDMLRAVKRINKGLGG